MVAGCGPIDWVHNERRGMDEAVRTGRRAIIEFVSTFDDEARQMDRDVFSDPEVVELMRRFVAVRLELGSNRQLAEECGVEQTPAFVIVRPDMTVAGMHQGTMQAQQFRAFLIGNSLN
jgi:hypothetical protein